MMYKPDRSLLNTTTQSQCFVYVALRFLVVKTSFKSILKLIKYLDTNLITSIVWPVEHNI